MKVLLERYYRVVLGRERRAAFGQSKEDPSLIHAVAGVLLAATFRVGVALPLLRYPDTAAFGFLALPGLVVGPVVFFLLAGLIHALSRFALKGTGSFMSQAYMLSLGYVPLEILAGVFGLLAWVPGMQLLLLLFPLVMLAIYLYEVVLYVFATMICQELTKWKAVGVTVLAAVVASLAAVPLSSSVSPLARAFI